jgi:hypothetical protein
MQKKRIQGSTEGCLGAIARKNAPTIPLDMQPLMMLPISRKILEKVIASGLYEPKKRNKSGGLYRLQGVCRSDM